MSDLEALSLSQFTRHLTGILPVTSRGALSNIILENDYIAPRDRISCVQRGGVRDELFSHGLLRSGPGGLGQRHPSAGEQCGRHYRKEQAKTPRHPDLFRPISSSIEFSTRSLHSVSSQSRKNISSSGKLLEVVSKKLDSGELGPIP
jgi:hypothetical protein